MGYIIKPWVYYALYGVAAVGGLLSAYLLWDSAVGPDRNVAGITLAMQSGLGCLLLAGLAAIIGLLTEIREKRD